MIRPLTLLCMILAAVSGAYMFAVKHRAQVLDDQLAAVAQHTRLDQERIRVLQAQWALETAPPRVKQLAAQFTDLQPLKPTQMATLATLTTLLPPPGKTPPPAPALVAAAAPAALPAATAAASRTASRTASPATMLASAAPPPANTAPTPHMAPSSASSAAPHMLSSATIAALAAAPLPDAPKPTTPAKLASVALNHAATVAHQPPLTPHPLAALRASPHIASTQLADNAAPRPLHLTSAPPPLAYHSPLPPSYHPTMASAGNMSAGNVSALAMAADLPPPRPLSVNGSNN